jgi:hypothetical protein
MILPSLKTLHGKQFLRAFTESTITTGDEISQQEKN